MESTAEVMRESEEAVNKNLRYKQILGILHGHQMTAKEIANEMWKQGMIPTNERNFSAPRLTELESMKWVERAEKKYCRWTGKLVWVYAERSE